MKAATSKPRAKRKAPITISALWRARDLPDGCFRAVRATYTGELRLGRTVYRYGEDGTIEVVRTIPLTEEGNGTAYDDTKYRAPSPGALVVAVSG